MAREGLMDDTGVEFEWDCNDCEDCIEKDNCATYEEMRIEQEREEEEWNKYYNDTRL